MKFKSVHPYEGTAFYAVPNESIEEWVELLSDLPKVDRAAGICSSGEIGFFAMLPKVRRQVTLVDHSCRSISFAATKWLLLRDLGWEKTYSILTSGDKALLDEAVETAKANLPEKLAKAFDPTPGKPVVDLWGFPLNNNYGSMGSTSMTPSLIKGTWDKIPKEWVESCYAGLNKVEFLHGDLSDLAERKPYDLLYLSNALQHQSRNGYLSDRTLGKLLKVVKPGGYIMCTETKTGYGTAEPRHSLTDAAVSVVQILKGKTDSWQKVIYQVAAA